jgi:cyclophilin family peptidyl-prolyl cis-trans isomerase
MANAGQDTNGSQWFVTLGPDSELNPTSSGSYTIFGNVIKGMNVVDKIGNVPTTTATGSTEKSQPKQAVYIDKITIASS